METNSRCLKHAQKVYVDFIIGNLSPGSCMELDYLANDWLSQQQ